MNNNTRFAVATHILALLSFSFRVNKTAELLAKSVNTNPVVIRRLIAQLKKSGLVTVRPGVGGASLTRPPEEISLLDVYRAVMPGGSSGPLRLHPNPNPMCFIGGNIHDALEMPLAKAEQALHKSLSTSTVADIADFIRSRRSKTGRQNPDAGKSA